VDEAGLHFLPKQQLAAEPTLGIGTYRPPRLTLAPPECSLGSSPRQAMSWRGLPKRERSPSSAISVAAFTNAMLHIVCRAATTGANLQSGASLRSVL
jgi:hypothetical protein